MSQSGIVCRSILGVLLGTALGTFFPSCGSSPNSPSPSLDIIAAHVTKDGIVVWDPNSEPALVLSVRGDANDPRLGEVQWSQSGWQVDFSDRSGPDLRVNTGSPGCGFGGIEFVITANSPNSSCSGSVTVRMERFLCPGSPWLD
jgi:hypothetical protein